MVIHYLGEGCFRLQSGELSLLVNPANNRLKADVVLKTIVTTETVPTDPHEIAFPGEYEMKGIEIEGRPLPAESTEKFVKTAYLVNWEEMRFLFLGHAAKPLPAELLEDAGEPDAIFVPAGDEHFISATDAALLIKQLEPPLVFPASYAKGTDALMKELGLSRQEPQEKFVFKKKDLEYGKRKMVTLRAS